MVYKLAAPSRMKDISWIRPGKVAWEWWNHWGIKGVDFEAGINNETYMHYIDFASRHGIEYVILDEGWAVNLKADLFQIVPEIDLKKLTAYARQKNVGLILWQATMPLPATWNMYASTIPKWASKDSRLTLWTGMTRKW